MTKAIGYVRVSTVMQANDGVSLDVQSAKIRAYCQLNDLELVEIVTDAGKSAKNTDREGLQTCLEKLANGEATELVVYKLDRLSRKVLDALNLINAIEACGGNLHSINEKLDTSSALGKFFVNMSFSLAQLESNQISERVTACMSYAKDQGQHLGQPAYGFKMVEKKLVKIDTEYQIIELANDLKADGATLQEIADELNSKGITTKRGCQWSKTQVSRLIKKDVA